MPPPTWRPRGSRGVRVSIRHALIPISLLFLMVLAFGFHLHFWILAVVAMVVPVSLVVSSIMLSKRLPRFEMEFNRFMQRGDISGMQKLYKESLFLQLMAPTDKMLAKKGMIYLESGDIRTAEELLEDAYDIAPPNRKANLLGGLARVKYQMGRFDELQEIAEQWRQRSLFPGSANVYLAAALLKSVQPDPEFARELLTEAKGSLAEQDRKLADVLWKILDS